MVVLSSNGWYPYFPVLSNRRVKTIFSFSSKKQNKCPQWSTATNLVSCPPQQITNHLLHITHLSLPSLSPVPAVPSLVKKKKKKGRRSPYVSSFLPRTYSEMPLLSFPFVHRTGNTFTNEYAYNFYSNASVFSLSLSFKTSVIV